MARIFPERGVTHDVHGIAFFCSLLVSRCYWHVCLVLSSTGVMIFYAVSRSSAFCDPEFHRIVFRIFQLTISKFKTVSTLRLSNLKSIAVGCVKYFANFFYCYHSHRSTRYSSHVLNRSVPCRSAEKSNLKLPQAARATLRIVTLLGRGVQIPGPERCL